MIGCGMLPLIRRIPSVTSSEPCCESHHGLTAEDASRLELEIREEQWSGVAAGEYYDVVLLCHVLYYFDDLDKVLASAAAAAARHVMIVHSSGAGDGISDVQVSVARALSRDQRGWEAGRVCTGEHIAAALDGLELPCTRETLDAALDCGSCLARTADGLGVLSFCLECDLRSAPPTVLDAVVAEVRQRCRPAAADLDTMLLHEGVDCFLVRTDAHELAPGPTVEPQLTKIASTEVDEDDSLSLQKRQPA